MLRSTFTAFYRSFTRHPLYALLNLLGLSLGIAVFITLALFVRFETTYERWVPNVDKLYMVENLWTFNGADPMPQPYTSGGMLDDVRADFPGTIGTRLWEDRVTVHIGARVTTEAVMLVDGDFFKLFDVPLLAGDKGSALATPDRVMLSKAMADKYFPDAKSPAAVIGRTVRLTDEEGTRDYRVAAVMQTVPANSELHFSFVRLLTAQYASTITNWKNYGSQRMQTVLREETPADVALMNSRFPAFSDRHAAGAFGDQVPHTIMHFRLSPLTRQHLADEKTRTSVYALGIVGILAFLIAAINYINLATARAGMRAKEVAVRKTLGATQGALRTQFLCEALLTTILAALIGLSLVEVSLPLINSFGDLKLTLDYVGEGLPLAAAGGFVLLAGLLAGLYPAFVLAGFKPAQVLASSRSPAGGRLAIRTREALVVLQFTVVVAFFIMVAGFLNQLQHMKSSDLGFTRSGLMVVDATYDPAISNSQRDVILAAFRTIPGVVSVTSAYAAPGDSSLTNNTDVAPKGHRGEAPSVAWVVTGPGFFDTYGGRLIAGRMLDPARGDDLVWRWTGDTRTKLGEDGVFNVILNSRATQVLGYKTPQAAIGQLLDFNEKTVRVAGVVADMRFRSPKDKIAPTLYVLDAHPYGHTITGLRFAGVSEPVMRARMEKVWRGIVPDVPFKAVSADENIDEYYKPDRNRSNLFSVGAGIAALIGCIGLYGMAAFNTSRRSREIGLRKVLGASSGQVTGLLIGQFLRPVIIANLLAWPIAWLALSHWLSQFDDAVAINPLIFVAASAVAILIALLTVGGLALVSAGSEPGKALRHD